ncbi:hypothetical protein IEQ34_016963 [Dendrobium chrysotoxum]|uniref:Ninja-family protein n=1 Tax=Dendrobium chrysotoxum TaxID=161865 RepID=A0AAV7FZN8_DENCH|nr:hypothetical protein IEQ34_016963 [Dendrobium chrysotoxum]
MEIELAEQEAEELSYPRDLLRRLSGTRCSEELLPVNGKAEDAEDFDEGDTELSLGLSLGGCFTVKPRETRLLRSSSTAVTSMFPNEVNFTLSSAPLARSCSLPVEAEDEHLKRKDMQGLKRMEVKRKRLEKRTSTRLPMEMASGDRKEEGWIGGTNGGILLRWDMGAAGCGMEVDVAQLKATRRRSSDFNERGLQGSKTSNLSSSSTVPSIPDTDQKSVAVPPLPPLLRSLKSFQEDEVLKRMTGNLNGSKDIGRNIIAEMPCVSTRGEGPNGKRIEGFLYKYTKGEIRIVCVCHGSTHTPAEFIKHAGGGDVENPLRHIVVSPTPSAYNY